MQVRCESYFFVLLGFEFNEASKDGKERILSSDGCQKSFSGLMDLICFLVVTHARESIMRSRTASRTPYVRSKQCKNYLLLQYTNQVTLGSVCGRAVMRDDVRFNQCFGLFNGGLYYQQPSWFDTTFTGYCYYSI